MLASQWQPTAHLCWIGGKLQQKWTRDCSDFRDVGGQRSMRHAWVEHEWREVPTEDLPALETSSTSGTAPAKESGTAEAGHSSQETCDDGLRATECPTCHGVGGGVTTDGVEVDCSTCDGEGSIVRPTANR